jgi:Zn-dependent peptidase ImmA (M78 family)
MRLAPIDPLPAADVADYFEVDVLSPHEIGGISNEDLNHLLQEGSQEWSGFTLGVSGRYLIVLNTAQSQRRQNSVLMHELAHIILGHQLSTGTISAAGYFVPANFDQDQEDEAAWLGGTLLLPRPALLSMRRVGMTNDQAATHFGVSPDLLSWRIRMTGIDYQLAATPVRHR